MMLSKNKNTQIFYFTSRIFSCENIGLKIGSKIVNKDLKSKLRKFTQIV